MYLALFKLLMARFKFVLGPILILNPKGAAIPGAVFSCSWWRCLSSFLVPFSPEGAATSGAICFMFWMALFKFVLNSVLTPRVLVR